MDESSAVLDFYAQRDVLLRERDAAYANRSVDPERWQEAKHAYAAFRTAVKQFSEAVGTRKSGLGITTGKDD